MRALLIWLAFINVFQFIVGILLSRENLKLRKRIKEMLAVRNTIEKYAQDFQSAETK